MPCLLAFDTSTELMSLALHTPQGVLVREAAGGAQASARLVPDVLALLAEGGVTLAQVDAIGYGRGPGAFTGLRTACSVAQGLAFGAGKPVLPLDSLLLVAEDARAQMGSPDGCVLWVAMDARMDEVYAASYRWGAGEGALRGQWSVIQPPALYTPQALQALWQTSAPTVVAGSALAAFGDRLPVGSARTLPEPRSRAAALARLALQAWEQGVRVAAEQAWPLYLRDKVAQTTAEREAARLAKEAS